MSRPRPYAKRVRAPVEPDPEKPWAVMGKSVPSEWAVASRVIRERDKVCQRCGSKRELHVHHVLPRARGGKMDGSTPLLLVCAGCHDYIHHPRNVVESVERGWLIT
jgi:5-methylcytosine-specific restriction endonuclease McrA